MKRLLVIAVTLLNISFAQLTLDRTRIIFDRDKSTSQSIVVSNTNKNEPYLAQSWIEDINGNKIEEPLVALPILQRINAGQEKQVKISLAGKNDLALDRESLLFFNVLGVPPKTDAENQVNIVIQSKVKMFYRPKGLKKYQDSNWIKELDVSKSGNIYTLQNPTPYHVVIVGFSSSKTGKIVEQDIVINPFDSSKVNLSLGNNPTIYFINDYGSTVPLSFKCNSSNCDIDL